MVSVVCSSLGADEGERRKKSHGKRQKEKSPERINFRLEPEDDQLFIWYAPHGHSGNTRREIERERAEIWLGTSNARNAVDRRLSSVTLFSRKFTAMEMLEMA